MITVIVNPVNPPMKREHHNDTTFRHEANRQAEFTAKGLREVVRGLTCPNGHEPKGTISITANYDRGPVIRMDDFCCPEMQALATP